MTLTLASCQFPVSADPAANAEHILRQMQQARQAGAHLAHFSETCLSGCLGLLEQGVELTSAAQIDWRLLRSQTERVMACAAELQLWVVLGSTHPLTGDHKPHNCLHVIDDGGRLVTRYDKRMAEVEFYSPGSDFTTFDVGGIRAGLQICADMRCPELYREYKKLGVQLGLHSYHNVGSSPKDIQPYVEQVTFLMQAAASHNFMWISANNASQAYAWSSFVVNPAGQVVGRLPENQPGVLVHTIDTESVAWDPARHARELAARNILHSGEFVSDPRSHDRARL